MYTSVIIGTGSFIPEIEISNADFLQHTFYEKAGEPSSKSNQSIIDKFSEITGIKARRYAKPDQNASDLGTLAAQAAITNAQIDKESIDYIIVAHNFGDVRYNSNQTDILPSLASRIKAKLHIENPDCVAYDVPFGCPGWVEIFIQANYYIRSGDAKRCLIIGADTLSRMLDPHDRDSMIYSDGAGAVIIEARPNKSKGLLSHKTQTYASQHAYLLTLGESYADNSKKELYIKMNGRRVYEFAISHVPMAIKVALDKAGVALKDVKKILIHQANEKMDEAIVLRLYKLFDINEVPKGIMPMTIGWLGNSSVATIPTMLDLILNDKMPDQKINEGDIVIFASVGAGMNINAIVYQF
ncbi:ketoacyl-ACP synthase III [Chryseotalea sanaruensis]|uniref:Ketoacyl-ACP synthase III n=1 Tax=Chryseotalea sanaruensis TaxID=2482724 RepID=A0A401U9L1_9BACT|nr:ketoacyl-ACP synthase III [Chryseotalea sanaruensis]GCC51567.1 ketoacyl-ACP synthase III [Chryseotalea sanaruensis]